MTSPVMDVTSQQRRSKDLFCRMISRENNSLSNNAFPHMWSNAHAVNHNVSLMNGCIVQFKLSLRGSVNAYDRKFDVCRKPAATDA